MKRISLAFLLLISTFVAGQATPPAQKPSAPATPPAATAPKPPQRPPAPGAPTSAAPSDAAAQLPNDTPVVTIPGVCFNKATGPDCKTMMTKAQFEQLMDTLAGGRERQQPVPAGAKRQLAIQYSRLLLFAAEAERKGLENSPEAQELLRFARLQALAQAMTRQLQKQSQPTPAEVQQYYDSNPPRFTELTLQRIMVPIKATGDSKTNEAEMKTLADQLRQRASTGADFKTLQAEAYVKAAMQNPPETKQVVLANALPLAHQAVLQLKPGEVSQVIQEPTGIYIYKLESKRVLPLEQVKPEIEPVLAQEKFQKAVDAMIVSSTPTLNPDYFGAAPPPGTGLGVRPAAPVPRQTPPPPKP
ncbi:MAG: peptidylprolyl isomerase [Terriglobales bacterium]